VNIVAIVQARTGSTRLPGKVLMDLKGEPMLSRVIHRLSRASGLSGIMIATTEREEDDAIVELCRREGWATFRGSENDVLDRYHQAANISGADAVVRVTSDCPLIDPHIVDRAVCEFVAGQPHVDYTSTTMPRRTFPRGLDVEVIAFPALEAAWRHDHNPAWREHVTPYIYRNPKLFRIRGVLNDTDLSGMRWTVDTPEDLELVRRIYQDFHNDCFSWRDALAVLANHPEWGVLNRRIEQKAI
jgi:spore coat polysaccharide biosynthesis protein SpsF